MSLQSATSAQTPAPAAINQHRSLFKRILALPVIAIRSAFDMKSKIGLAIISGLLLATGLPNLNLWPVAFVALMPFLWSLRNTPRGRAAFLGLVFGWTYYYASIFWLNAIWPFAPVLLETKQQTLAIVQQRLMAGVGVVLLAVYCGAFYAIFGWIGAKLWQRNPAWAALSLPALWTILEWIRSLGQLAFPWAYLADTQSSNLAFIQMADLGGTWLISFVLVAINLLLTEICFNRFESQKPFLVRLGVVVLLIAIPYGYGAFRMHQNWATGEALHVAISQTNIDQPTKFYSYAFSKDPEARQLTQQIQAIQFEDVLRIHQAAPQTQLYVLPETAFTQQDFQNDEELKSELAGLAHQIKGSIFFGADNGDIDPKTKQERIYVAAWMVDPLKGVLPKPYEKMRLVPFGESLPYFEYIPYFQEKVLSMVTAARGREYRTFTVDGMRFGCGICFESSSPMQLVQMVRHGAQFLTVITNDSWYFHRFWTLDNRGAAQHDALSTFRAIENRRWVIRAACTGISRIIDAAGRTVKQAPREERTYLVGDIHAVDARTPYTRFGDWFIVIAAAFVLVSFRKPGFRE